MQTQAHRCPFERGAGNWCTVAPATASWKSPFLALPLVKDICWASEKYWQYLVELGAGSKEVSIGLWERSLHLWPYWPTSKNDDDYVSFFWIWGLSLSFIFIYIYDVFITTIFSLLWWCLINFLLIAFIKISLFLSLPNSLQSLLISPRSPSSSFTLSCWSISPYSSIQSTLQPESFLSASRILILCPLNWWTSWKWKQDNKNPRPKSNYDLLMRCEWILFDILDTSQRMRKCWTKENAAEVNWQNGG